MKELNDPDITSSDSAWTRSIPWALAFVTGLAFLPAIPYDFVCWDDEHNFTWNLDFGPLSWPHVRWAWETYRTGVYQPLAWIFLEAEASLWGLDARGYHAASVALHAANATMIYRLIFVLLGRCSEGEGRGERRKRSLVAGLATLLFAVHPLRVEVVAWASCQPYLPSIFCTMLATLAYLRSHPRGGRTSVGWLVLSWIWYAVAVLFKAEAATLPGVLVVLDFYPLRRLGAKRWRDWGVWLEKVPFATLGVVIVWVAARARGVLQPEALTQPIGIASRLAQACYSLGFYPSKTAWPVALSIFYGLPERVELTVWPFWPAAVAVVVVGLIVLLAGRQWPGVVAACSAYAIFLIPHLGFVQTGPVIAADRYSYLASIPLTVLLAGGLERLLGPRNPLRGVIVAACLGVVLVLTGLSWEQCRQWRTSEVLLKSALERGGSRSPELRSALGLALSRSGQLSEAASYCEEALRMAPDYFQAHFNLGVIRGKQGLFAEAERHFAAAERIDSGDRDAQFNLAVALARQGKTSEAIGHFQQALRIRPFPEDAFSLAILLNESGRHAEAVDAYQEAIRLRPDHAPTHNNLAAVLIGLGKYPEAEAQFQEALRLQPNYQNARKGLEYVRQKLGRSP